MGSTQAYHNPVFLREIWALYGVGIAVMLLRIFVRLRSVGVRNFQGDDYIIILVIFCYTQDAVNVQLTYHNGSNVDYTPERLAQFNAQEHRQIVFGSKMQLFSWYTYTALVWALKACMLFFFNRLTLGLDSQRFVKILAVACGITYVATFLTITLGCHPIHLNWQTLPYPPLQCTLKTQNFYVCTILNALTDGAMLCIPMPILWKLRVSIRRKLALAAMLCSGVFVITAALIRIIMTLKSHPSALNINRWGVRETLAGIVAVNIPVLRPLFSKAFWTGNIPPPEGTPHAYKPELSGHSGHTNRLTSVLKGPDAFEMIDQTHSPQHTIYSKAGTATTARTLDEQSDLDDDAASDDFIIQKPSQPLTPGHDESVADVEKGGVVVKTMVKTTYDVRPTSSAAEHDTDLAQPEAGRHSGRFWDQTWQDRRLGNSVLVESDNRLADYR